MSQVLAAFLLGVALGMVLEYVKTRKLRKSVDDLNRSTSALDAATKEKH